ncbi:phosphotransferase [Dactylosporangium aurantiacum]|uniref:Phosphotransferase n=1 Tax=Dactylosporangium aurantiacum TaxID=35754 RepID=A0A9Q9IEN8_9ACTN|nr:phosphotransferase [Dactylosporangium aurantiacum]MDG6103455.1 phosphotransferase [Dactylosporangium aurantiacum]UWZ52039.1 phosphotransferase [Dactylosporangium aurantiacum]
MVQASGVRIGWDDLPSTVHAAVTAILGGPVVRAVSQPGGFSPGTADRVLLADGSRAFVKAVSAAQNAHSVQLHRTEARVTAMLPADVPAPRLLGFHDDGTWVALVFADVEGRQPHVPWQDDELAAVLDALRRLPVPVSGLPSLPSLLADSFGGWRRLAADPPAALDPWAASNLDLLVELADRGVTALAGDRLVHVDIRADNLLIRPDGSVMVVDWPGAAVGVPWFDTLSLLLNVRLYGGAPSDTLLDVFEPDPADVTAVIAGLAALFTDRGREPDPPGLPTLRRFQQDQAAVMLPWLRARLAAGLA